MKYNEEKAKELIAQERATPDQVKVWKTRGDIPDRLFSDWTRRKPVKENATTQKIRNLFETKFFNRVNFRSWKDKDAGSSFVRRLSRLDKSEEIGLKGEFLELRNKAKKLAKNMKNEKLRDDFFLDVRIKSGRVLGSNKEYNRVRANAGTIDFDLIGTRINEFILITKF